MSQNRDTDRGGPNDKPAKKTKYSDVGEEGNLSPSTPTKNATETESSDKMDEQPYRDDSKSSSKKGRFLFKKLLTANEVEDDMLFFPYELASPHFHPAEPISEENLDVMDIQGNEWVMTLTYSPVESTFIITTKWNEFVYYHNLQATDKIQFYRPDPPKHDKHYGIHYVRSMEVDDTDNETDDDQDHDHDLDQMGNFLFELELKRGDTGNRIAIPEEQVVNHFPEIKKPTTDEPVTHEYFFTDEQNKDWCMKTMFNEVLHGYMIMDGWKGFVNEHKLKAMDVIKLYEPSQPSPHKIHFLIVVVKKEEGDSAEESDEGQGGSSESGCSNDMEIN